MPDTADSLLNAVRGGKPAPAVDPDEQIANDPRFNTVLSPDEEPKFQAWKATLPPTMAKDSGFDYDYRGAFKAGLTPDPTQDFHLPDTFKKPNHPTFSDQSQYAAIMPERAGKWDGKTYVPHAKPVVATSKPPSDTAESLLADVRGPENPVAPPADFEARGSEYDRLTKGDRGAKAFGAGAPSSGVRPGEENSYLARVARDADKAATAAVKGLDEATGPPGTDVGLDLLHKAGGLARGVGNAFGVVASPLSALVPDPRAEAPAADFGGRAEQALRSAIRFPLDAPSQVAKELTELPGIRQGLDATVGEQGRQDIADIGGLAIGGEMAHAMKGAIEGPAPDVAPPLRGIAPGPVRAATADAAIESQRLGKPLTPEQGNVLFEDRRTGFARNPKMDESVTEAQRLGKPLDVEQTDYMRTNPASRRDATTTPTDTADSLLADVRGKTKFSAGPTVGRESGALGLPNIGKTMADQLPPGTAAERAAVSGVKERIRFGDESTPSIGQQAMDLGQKAEAALVRREAPLRRVEKGVVGGEEPTGVTAQAKFAQGSSGVASENLASHGFLDEKDVPKVQEAIKRVVDAGRPTSDISAYAAAKRAVTDYEPNQLTSGFDPTEAQATVDLYEKNHPEVVAAADALKDVNVALRENFMEADRWDPKRRADLEDRNKYPIEFARDFGDAAQADTNQPAGRTTPFPGPKMKTRTGGSQPIRDPLVRFQENARRMIAGADQATVRHAFLDTIARDPAKAAQWVEPLTTAQLKAQIPDFESIAQRINPSSAPEDWASTFDAWDKANSAGIIPDGNGGYLRVKDPALMRAISGGDMHALEAKLLDMPVVGHAMKVAKAVTGLQRLGITGLSPSFPIMNAIRDAATYPLQASKYGNDFSVGMNYARGMYQAIRGELAKVPGVGKVLPETPFNELARRSRLQSFSQTDTIESAPKNLAKMDEGLARYYVTRPHKAAFDAVRGAANLWKDVNSLVELGPRYAGMLNELDAVGWKPGQPITRDLLVRIGNAGQEATVNFRLGGEVTKAANRYVYNFVNPAVQGIEQLRQSAENYPATFSRRVATYYVAPAVGAWLWWHSDEKKKAAWDRMTPWRRAQANVPLTDDEGNVHALSLPLPQEAGVFYTGTIAALDELHGEGAPYETMKEALDRAMPVDSPLHPSAIQPIAEVKQGFSDFSGRSINPRNMEGGDKVAPFDVAQPYTGKTARALSKFLWSVSGGKSTVTAAEIEHLFGGYGGTVARDASRVAPTGETEAADRPFIGRLTPRMSESRFVDDYYDLRSKYEGQTNMARALRRPDPAEAAKLRLPSGISSSVADLDAALKQAQDQYRNASQGERQRVAARMDNLAKQGLRMLRASGVGKEK